MREGRGDGLILSRGSSANSERLTVDRQNMTCATKLFHKMGTSFSLPPSPSFSLFRGDVKLLQETFLFIRFHDANESINARELHKAIHSCCRIVMY